MSPRRRPRRVPRPPIDGHPRSWHAGYNQGFDDRGRLPCDDPACPRRYGDATNRLPDVRLGLDLGRIMVLACGRCGVPFLTTGGMLAASYTRPDLLARQLLEHQCSPS